MNLVQTTDYVQQESVDLLLLSPPSRMLSHYRPPMAMIYVGGYSVKMGMSVKVVDIPVTEQVRTKKYLENQDLIVQHIKEQVLQETARYKPLLIGIGCYSTEWDEVLELIAEVQKIHPSTPIAVGGIHPTLKPYEFFEDEAPTGVDICVVGEGEIPTYEILKQLKAGSKDLRPVKGLVYKDFATGEIVDTGPGVVVDDLDEISFPDYSLVDMDYYSTATPYAVRGIFLRATYMMATRGCPSLCTFCVARQLRPFSLTETSSFRIRSPQSILDELKQLKEQYQLDGFYFIDDMYTANKPAIIEFCRLLTESGMKMLWGCSSKVTKVDEEIIKAMAEAGCVQIDFGVERGSDASLRALKKGITLKKVRQAFDLCRKYKIRALGNMLANLPGETEDDLRDMEALVEELKPEVVFFNVFTPFPGTEIYDKLPFDFKKEDYGLLGGNIMELIEKDPQRFRYAEHDVDLGAWSADNNRKYNSYLRMLKFYISPLYWRTLAHSNAKSNYFKQLGLLVKEAVNQKLG